MSGDGAVGVGVERAAAVRPALPGRLAMGRPGRLLPARRGMLELSGVFAGMPSLASSAATWAIKAAICPAAPT